MQFKFFKSALLAALFVLSINFTHAQFRVVGYMPTWGNWAGFVNSADWSKLTHVNIAFGNPNGSGQIEEGLSDLDIANLVNRVHAEGGKVLISLGGASAPSYDSWLSAANRDQFVQNVLDYVEYHNLDGVDVDLEGGNIPTNYDEFVVALADSLQPEGKLVTAALGTWYSWEIPQAALDAFDWVNIMSYDKTGPWNPGNPGQHSSYQHAIDDLAHWKGRGLSSNEVVLGVPFYGYDFDNSGAYTTYSTIVNSNVGAENTDQVGQIYYNGQPTMEDKTELAWTEASGVMIWEITQDVAVTDNRSLLLSICQTVDGLIGFPQVEITYPTNGGYVLQDSTVTIVALATDTNGSIDSVSFYVDGVFIGSDSDSSYEVTWSSNTLGTYNLTAVVVDNEGNTITSATNIITVAEPQTAFNGPHNIPGTIEAEDYDNGAQGQAYYDADETNNGGEYRTDRVDIEVAPGGYNVGWIADGEWMEYTVTVDTTASYQFNFRVASNTGGGRVHLELDDIDITGDVNIGNTGGWQSWITKSVGGINLTAGDYVLKIAVDEGNFNLDYITAIVEVSGVDCNGDTSGTATIDQCQNCSGGNTGLTPNEECADCNGDPNGTASIDQCSACSGGNTGVPVDDCLTSINPGVSNNAILLYPNPSNGIIHIQSVEDNHHWRVYNTIGNMVKNGGNKTIDLSNLSSGVYLILIDTHTFRVEKL